MNPISRRAVLKQLALGGLLTNLPTLPAWAGPSEPSQALAGRVARLFSNRSSAGEVGRRYLALGSEPADAASLAGRVAGSRVACLRLCAADTRSLRKLLAQQQRQDFASGHTVNVDGWVLSLTEARLCAIAALVGNKA